MYSRAGKAASQMPLAQYFVFYYIKQMCSSSGSLTLGFGNEENDFLLLRFASSCLAIGSLFCKVDFQYRTEQKTERRMEERKKKRQRR
jgi:hypothetical protein